MVDLTDYENDAEWLGLGGSGDRYIVRTTGPRYSTVGLGTRRGEWGRVWMGGAEARSSPPGEPAGSG